MGGIVRELLPIARSVVFVAFATIAIGLGGAASHGEALGNSFVQDPSNLHLELGTSEQVLVPGQHFVLTTIISGGSESSRIDASVTLWLPLNISFDARQLESGATYSLRDNAVTWWPVWDGAGERKEFTLELSAGFADMRAPNQEIVAILEGGNTQRRATASVWVGVPPSATILATPQVAAVGQPVALSGVISGPGPLEQVWLVGDGRVIEATDPEVVFASAGRHEVSLQASNPAGFAIATAHITVVPAPFAEIALDDTTIAVGRPIVLSSRGGGQPPLSYYWELGDGTNSEEAAPTHAYGSAGAYVIRLSISNEYGDDESSLIVYVGEPPTVDIALTSVGAAGLTTSGQAVVSGNADAITWDTGDGATYQGPYLSHSYGSPGEHVITVTVVNEFGEAQARQAVTIAPGVWQLLMPLLFGGDGLEPQPEQISIGGIDAAVQTVLNELESLPLPQTLSPTERIFAYLNQARRARGLRALTLDLQLSAAAQAHTADMASNGFGGHVGSDGSSPAYRIHQSGYAGGYAGEATAWGMAEAIEPVRFWLESDAHREIILNPAAEDVGVGYSVNFDAPSVWYWTAEFASPNLPVVSAEPPVAAADEPPQLELLGPPEGSEFILAAPNELIFTWNWPVELAPDQAFTIYMKNATRIYAIGSIRRPVSGQQYQFSRPITSVPINAGGFEWQVRLENVDTGLTLIESPFRPIYFRLSPDA